jgi:transposase
MEVGAEVAHRLLRYLQMHVSGDTLLRILRRFGQVHKSNTNARVIGVDDWAFKRGRTYGTIIVNLETHHVIDLLPDRTAETLATWLQAHPKIEIVARDRSSDYSAGICQGAPQAIQVADRWHLLLNLRQMLERYLTATHTILQALPISEAYQSVLDQQRLSFMRTKTERIASNKSREARVALYEHIQQLRQAGASIAQLIADLDCHPVTITKYFYATSFPERKRRKPSKSILDAYIPYLEQRILEGCENAQQLWREIQQQGYPGTNKQVSKWVQMKRTTVSPKTPHAHQYHLPDQASQARLPSCKQIAWLLVRDPAFLLLEDRELLSHIQQSSQLADVYIHAQNFVSMVRHRRVEQLDDWLIHSDNLAVYQVQTFAKGLRQDYAAIHAALSFAWSNGQTEGQVNRLKFIKRQMYGRAKFDLLRIRVLSSP